MTLDITIVLVGEGDQKVAKRFYMPLGDDKPAEQVYRDVIKLLDHNFDFVIPGTSQG